MKIFLALSLIVATFLIASTGYSVEKEKHRGRVLKATVTKVTGDTFFYKTEEGTTRNFSVMIVEKFELIPDLKVGDRLALEFSKGNELINMARLDVYEELGRFPNHLMVKGTIIGSDRLGKNVTIKLKDGTTQTYGVIPPVSNDVRKVPEGTDVMFEIDEKFNLVTHFHKAQ